MKRLLVLALVCLAVVSCKKEGCTDSNAVNYDSNANFDNGSCVYDSSNLIFGCMNTNAINYNSNASIDDGSCVYFPNIDWSLYPDDSNNYLTLYDFINLETNWNLNLNTKRNILLENYAGHRCVNCPDASIIAEDLENDSSLGVVVVSIQASPDGYFQSTDGTYQTDFTTEAGDIYVVDMPGMFANPLGTINRKSNGLSGSVWQLSNSWETAVNQETYQPLLANIQVKTNYFPSTNGLFIHTETEFNSDLVGNYHLIIYLLRNSIISPQSMSNGSTNYNYNHHHVLSKNINGTWGTSIASGSINENSKFYNDFSFELPTDTTYNIDNLSLITYLCERNTFEIIQVTKTDF